MHQIAWYIVLGLVASYAVRWLRDPLRRIPTVGGPSAPLLSYLGSIRYLRRAQEIIQQGYNKYHGSAFKVAMFDQWLVVLSGPELVEQVRKLPDHIASPLNGLLYLTQVDKYTPQSVVADQYHVEIVRHKLTHQLASVLPRVMDEVQAFCGEVLPTKEREAVSLPCAKTMLDIIARAAGRTFVGLPMCRNPLYLEAASSFTIDVVKARFFINLFPEFMKGTVSRFLSGPRNNLARAIDLLQPLIEERERVLEQQEKGENGEALSPENPDDFLQWIIEEAHERKLGEPVATVLTRLQLMNFAAMHTTSNSLTHAFYHLLSNPEIIEPIRAEVEQVLSAEGWTRSAVDKMHKLDSLLKESQRLSGINILGMVRRAMQDITLTDGTHIPEGTLFAFAAQSLHSDAQHYPDPMRFEPFRFSDARGEEGTSARHRYINTSSEYIPFGRGKHACPGRFFASMELKAILAYLVMNYDMELEGGAVRPKDFIFGFSVIPSAKAVAVFRKRQV